MLEGMKKKELEAFLQVKKSCELAEEIQLQNQEVLFDLRAKVLSHQICFFNFCSSKPLFGYYCIPVGYFTLD